MPEPNSPAERNPNTASEVVSIRLPPGLANELRAVTSLPLSTLARRLLVSYLNSAKQRK